MFLNVKLVVNESNIYFKFKCKGKRDTNWLLNFSFQVDTINTIFLDEPLEGLRPKIFNYMFGTPMPQNIRIHC